MCHIVARHSLLTGYVYNKPSWSANGYGICGELNTAHEISFCLNITTVTEKYDKFS